MIRSMHPLIVLGVVSGCTFSNVPQHDERTNLLAEARGLTRSVGEGHERASAVSAAAYLGHLPARLALGVGWEEWLAGLAEADPRVAAYLSVCSVDRALPFMEEGSQEFSLAQKALTIARKVLGGDKTWAVRGRAHVVLVEEKGGNNWTALASGWALKSVLGADSGATPEDVATLAYAAMDRTVSLMLANDPKASRPDTKSLLRNLIWEELIRIIGPKAIHFALSENK